MEIQTVIMNGIIELVKQGGPLALWGIFIWLGLNLIKLVVVSVVFYLVVKTICNTITTNYKVHKECKSQRISLLSETISHQVSDSLNTFSKESGALATELTKLLRELKESSAKK